MSSYSSDADRIAFQIYNQEPHVTFYNNGMDVVLHDCRDPDAVETWIDQHLGDLEFSVLGVGALIFKSGRLLAKFENEIAAAAGRFARQMPRMWPR